MKNIIVKRLTLFAFVFLILFQSLSIFCPVLHADESMIGTWIIKDELPTDFLRFGSNSNSTSYAYVMAYNKTNDTFERCPLRQGTYISSTTVGSGITLSYLRNGSTVTNVTFYFSSADSKYSLSGDKIYASAFTTYYDKASAIGMSYRTIYVTAEPTDADFVAWLKHYAEKQPDPVTFVYENYLNPVMLPNPIYITDFVNIPYDGFGQTTDVDCVGIFTTENIPLFSVNTLKGGQYDVYGLALRSGVVTATGYVLGDTKLYSASDVDCLTLQYLLADGSSVDVAHYAIGSGTWFILEDFSREDSLGIREYYMTISNVRTDADMGYISLDSEPLVLPTVEDETASARYNNFIGSNISNTTLARYWYEHRYTAGVNRGQSDMLGEHLLGQTLQAPFDVLNAITIYTTPSGTPVTLMGIFGVAIGIMLVSIFLKLFAGG